MEIRFVCRWMIHSRGYFHSLFPLHSPFQFPFDAPFHFLFHCHCHCHCHFHARGVASRSLRAVLSAVVPSTRFHFAFASTSTQNTEPFMIPSAITNIPSPKKPSPKLYRETQKGSLLSGRDPAECWCSARSKRSVLDSEDCEITLQTGERSPASGKSRLECCRSCSARWSGTCYGESDTSSKNI